MHKARIQAFSGTMRHIWDAADIIADDLQEMARRVNHPEGRKGIRSHGLTSEIGIHGYPKETIRIELGKVSDSSNIIVLHEIGDALLTITYEGTIVVRFPDKGKLIEMPKAMATSLHAEPLSRLIDFENTSIPELGEARIQSIYAEDTDKKATVYAKGSITKYDAEIFAQELRRKAEQENLLKKSQ